MNISYKQIFFLKPPVPGEVKTRLGIFLGMKRAALIYEEILLHLIPPFDPVAVELFSDKKENLKLLENIFPEYGTIQIQNGNDLGKRMANAVFECHTNSKGLPILLTGSDIPDYNPKIAARAVEILQKKDIVLGPTFDGGYYLIGFNPEHAAKKELLCQIFENINWSTADVFEKQIRRLKELGCDFGRLEELSDIDTFSDLAEWRNRGNFFVAKHFPDIRVILPVYNEAESLPAVLKSLQKLKCFSEIICADNGSSDESRNIAREYGATATLCQELGYGATCLTAIADIREKGGCDLILFMDADGADDPAVIPALLQPILSGDFDFAIGSRLPELAEPRALLPQARFGNWLATLLIRIFWKYDFKDLGPLRAIAWPALEKLAMDDRNYGWTIQMQIRALKNKLRVIEIPVPYRRRFAGKSKVTANPAGILRAGRGILGTILKELLN